METIIEHIPEFADLSKVRIGSTGVAKVWSVLCILKGYERIINPDRKARKYLVERRGNVEAQNLISECCGGEVLVTGLASFCLLFYENISALTAVGYCGLAWCLILYKWMLQVRGEKAGAGPVQFLLLVANAIVTAYACLGELGWAASYKGATIRMFALSAVCGIVSPRLGLQMWGYKDVDDRGSQEYMSVSSFLLLGQELQFYLLLNGVVSADKSLAYAFIPSLGYYVNVLFVTKTAHLEIVKTNEIWKDFVIVSAVTALILFLE